MSKNIFEIKNPSEWHCEVTQLATGHGHLVIKLSVHSVNLELRFHHVEYYAGWTQWKGTNFRIGTQDELIELVKQIHTKASYSSDKELLHKVGLKISNLFICETDSGGTIFIVADSGSLYDKDGNKLKEKF